MGALVKAGQQLPAEQQAAAEQQQYLTFVLGGEMFAIGILCVKEIIEYGDLTVVPMMPECIRGVINLRGAVLPIMDLAGRLGLPMAEPTVRHVIIVVKAGDRIMGMMVDAVSDILAATPDMIQETPDLACEEVKGFLNGIVTLDGRMISEIALERLLPGRDQIAA